MAPLATSWDFNNIQLQAPQGLHFLLSSHLSGKKPWSASNAYLFRQLWRILHFTVCINNGTWEIMCVIKWHDFTWHGRAFSPPPPPYNVVVCAWMCFSAFVVMQGLCSNEFGRYCMRAVFPCEPPWLHSLGRDKLSLPHPLSGSCTYACHHLPTLEIMQISISKLIFQNLLELILTKQGF
jgi:hypothetical protein